MCRQLASAVLVAVLIGPLHLGAQTADGIGSITAELRAGEFDRAVQLLQAKMLRNPKNAQLWMLDGIALSGKGNKKDALAAFQRALKISPDYLPALEGAEQIEYESGDQGAVSLLQHILKLRPSETTSHAMLATLAYQRGDCSTAIPHFEASGSPLDAQPKALEEYGNGAKGIEQATLPPITCVPVSFSTIF
jgi:tetratricopeptide (TPR) repeat protein